MHVDLTRHSLGWTLLLFAGLTALFWMRGVAAPLPEAGAFSTQMPLGLWIDRAGAWLPLGLRNLLIVLIVFWNGLLLTRVMSRNMLVLERTYMPFILYLLVACGLSFGRTSLAPYVAAGLLVTAFDLMVGSFRRVVVYAKSFDSALLTGLSALVYGPAAVYALLLPCSLILFRKGWREWLTTTVGLALPFLIASYVYWGLGEPFLHVWNLWLQEMSERLGSPFFWQQTSEAFRAGSVAGSQGALALMIAAWVPIVLVTWAALAVFLFKARSMRTRPYKTYLYFVWILFFSLLLGVTPGGSAAELPLLAAPLAIVMPTYFNRFGGKWPGNGAYLLLLGCVILYNLLTLFSA